MSDPTPELPPLEDPRYEPKHPPVNGRIPPVVARWGPRSQLRWFQRFSREIDWGRRPDVSGLHPHSLLHPGFCCPRCEEEGEGRYAGHCCCRAPARDA